MAIRGIERLKRVIWRLQENPKEWYTRKEIELAIMYECGTDPRTQDNNFNSLKKLGWISCMHGRWYIKERDYF